MNSIVRCFWIALTAAVMFSACSMLPRNWRRKNHFPPKELRSENPVDQVRAIHEVVENQDKTQLPVLIEMMLGDEPSVRNHAYWGVTQLTGLTKPENTKLMYHYYDNLEERKKAVATWRSYWQEHSVP